MRRLRVRVVSALVVAGAIAVACTYTPPNPLTDAGSDGPPMLPDAGPCEEVSAACFSEGSGTVLSECVTIGEAPVITPCPWGCVDDPEAHCGLLQPSGGAVMAQDLVKQQAEVLADIDLASEGISIDTDTGAITDSTAIDIRPAGPGVVNGIDFVVRNNVGVFRFNRLTITNNIRIRGINGVALVALSTIEVRDEIELLDCNNPGRAQGGFVGGTAGLAGGSPAGVLGASPGLGVDDDASGGAGGAHAGGGGSGGPGNNELATATGATFGDATITILRGGGGGGGGTGGRGGNGGGAIQLVSNSGIAFVDGRINAGGCGGQAAQAQTSAAGGGAGGAILLESTTIVLDTDSSLAVNGGGGGGGDDTSNVFGGGGGGSTNGQNGPDDARAANGGDPGPDGGAGGDGASNTTFAGSPGLAGRGGGGGGGGVGWIRLNTLAGTATVDTATISPVIATGSPASIGVAVVQ